MIFAFLGRDDYRRRAALASALSARRLADSRAGGLFLPGLFDLEKEGDVVWERFNSPKEKQTERYKNLVEAFETVWKENPLLPEIKIGVEKLS